MSRNALITIVVVIVLLGAAGWYLLKSNKQTFEPLPQTTQAPAASESVTPPPATSGAEVKSDNLVTITSGGFSPKDVTVKVGDTVSWVNSDSVEHTVNSAVHPTHLVYPPLNLDALKPAESKSLSFPKAGTYKYHDHLNPSLFGSVTVQ